jgi:hypothetical protein
MGQVERVRRKLRTVPWPRGRRRVYGEDAHQWQVRPPRTEDEVVAAESVLGVRLPASYRTYLLAIADGRAGPGNGIYPLLEVDDPVGDLNVACPLDPGEFYDGRRWALRFEDGPDPYDGLLPIGNRGCSYVDALVVTGAARGRVVHIDLERSPPRFYPEPTFLDWYERWLDNVAGVDEG